jgi:hypothetical protein
VPWIRTRPFSTQLRKGPTEAAREPPPVRFCVGGGSSVKQQRQTHDELQSRADEERRLREPFGENRTAEEDWLKDDFLYIDLRSLAMKIRGLPDGAPDWVAKTAEMLRVFAGLTDPNETAVSGQFKRENREVLEEMRQADCDTWSIVEHHFGDRDRKLRESGNAQTQ